MMTETVEINVLVDEGFAGCPKVSWLKKVVKQVLVAQGVNIKAELSLVITGQEKIRQLNLAYLGEDQPTDVLSFPMLAEPSGFPFVIPPGGKKHLGDVIISYPQAVIQAEEHRHSLEREMAILIIHGVLHLLGYDHEKAEQEQEMCGREAEIMSNLEKELK